MAVIGLKLKKKGLIDLDAIYGLVVPYYTGLLYDFMESLHKDKGYEIQYGWTGEKKVSEYIKFKIDVKIEIYDVSKVDVKQNGKTKSMISGSAKISITGDIETDHYKKLERFPKFKKFYEKYLIKGKIDDYEDDVSAECLDLYDQMKAILEFE